MNEPNDYNANFWMNYNMITLNKHTTVQDALETFTQANKSELPVLENKKCIGVLRLHDLVKALPNCLNTSEQCIDTYVVNSFNKITEDTLMTDIDDLPAYVIDEEGHLMGEITKNELVAFNKKLNEQLRRVKDTVKWYELCFDTAYEGLTVVDENGIIQIFNETYSRYVGISKDKAIGKHADSVIENTRLPTVLKTGVPERSQAHQLQGQSLVVHRLPIWKDNKVIGAVGMLVYEGVSEIYQVIERMEQLDRGMQYMKKQLNPNTEYLTKEKIRFEDILGESHAISKTKQIARKAARSKATVLITGESGVGKEQFANAIHDMGITHQGNFVSVNCAAIPENLIESELFGYEPGAFTGARAEGKVGKFELANEGTLFLDEIGEMPLQMQVKILRVIQERKVERIGGNQSIPIDFRIIAATNRDLKQMVDAGEFREDLYYRLYVIPIHIPPLRERINDIPLMVAHKLRELSKEYGVKEKTIDQKILRKFYQYDWPGNVRELMNVLERLFVLSEGDHISYHDFPNIIFPQQQKVERPIINNRIRRHDLEKQAEQEEIEAIKLALQQAGGNKSQAAKILNISRATLYNKLTRFSIE